MRENLEHAGQNFRIAGVDARDPALRNGARDQIAIGGIGDREVRAVACFAGDFQAAVDTWFGTAHVVFRLRSGASHAGTSMAAACRSARLRVRFPSSTLYKLPGRGCAPSN